MDSNGWPAASDTVRIDPVHPRRQRGVAAPQVVARGSVAGTQLIHRHLLGLDRGLQRRHRRLRCQNQKTNKTNQVIAGWTAKVALFFYAPQAEPVHCGELLPWMRSAFAASSGQRWPVVRRPVDRPGPPVSESFYEISLVLHENMNGKLILWNKKS